jgi:hypothetical protein
MICSVCSTRIPGASSNCPNCGNDIGSGRGRKRSEAVTSGSVARLPLTRAPEPLETEDDAVDLELEEPARARTASISPDLRGVLADQPELLERGLKVYVDDKGDAVGVDFTTEVGVIDLLAEDARGGLVVVSIAQDRNSERIVQDALRRVGWVRKHLGKVGQKVRGIVLIDRQPDNLSYAAAAVAETVSFKTWRLALTFQEIDI